MWIHGCINVGSPSLLKNPPRLMYMPKNMVPGLPHLTHPPQRLRTPVVSLPSQIQHIVRRAVRHQDIHLLRHTLPNRIIMLHMVLECIADVIWGVRGAKDGQPLNLHALVLQVDAPLLELGDDVRAVHLAGIFGQIGCFFVGGDGVIIEGDLVITGNHDLVLEIEFLEEGEEVLEVLMVTVVGEVPSMDEDVALLLVCDFAQYFVVLVRV